MDRLEKTIGYEFRDKRLLHTALSHTSYVNELKSGEPSNERLEFLGDSILGMITADYLYRQYPDMPEGNMTKLRAELVCEKSLARVGNEIGLGEYLLLGKGEELCGGRERPSIIADAVEAVIAAMYLDGGRKTVKQFIYDRVLSRAGEYGGIIDDCKTALQELVQRTRGNSIEYRMTGESGPDHNKRFEATVYINGQAMGTGTGRSKKDAEQRAAGAALEKYGSERKQA